MFSDQSCFQLEIRIGIYVPPSPLFPREFHDIGIRIEVNVEIHVIDALSP